MKVRTQSIGERNCSCSLGNKLSYLLKWLNRVMVLIGIETKEQQRDIVGGHVADCCKKAEGLLSSMNKSQGDTESIGNKGIEAKDALYSLFVLSYAKRSFLGMRS